MSEPNNQDKNPLLKEFQYFIEHQDELVDKYRGKYVVIKDCQVIGVFDDVLDAVEETSKTHDLGTFLVQLAEPGPDCYTMTFTSRVSFAHV